MNENNQNLLRQSANRLIQVIGPSQERISSAIPVIDTLIQQVQSSLIPGSGFGQYGIGQELGEGVNDEKKRIAMRMSGFDAKDNRVWAEIARRFGANVKQGELTNIAQVIANHAGIKLDRDAKRRKCVLLKWFDENWEKITPFLDYVILASSDEETPQQSQQQMEQQPQQIQQQMQQQQAPAPVPIQQLPIQLPPIPASQIPPIQTPALALVQQIKGKPVPTLVPQISQIAQLQTQPVQK